MRVAVALIAAAVVVAAAPVRADDAARDLAALKNSQGAIGSVVPATLGFIDTDGQAVSLGDFRGRPLLVSLIYTGCTDVCPLIIDNLHPAIEVAQDALGSDSFATITVGFDTSNDTPERMRSFALAHGVERPNWQFLAGDADTIESLANAVGFEIVPSAGGFDHMAQITILDGNGRIYGHVYGGAFEPPAIVEPLKDLVFGRQRPVTSLAGLIDRVKLFCTIYSPNTGRYYFNYSLFIGMAIGIVCLLGVAVWLVREFRRSGAEA